VNEEMFQNPDESPRGPGILLQAAREEKNLRPEDVAYELRLTSTQVLALEENDYSRMPEETYVRGYLRNYARLVGVAENDILMAFARLIRGSENKSPVVLPGSETKQGKTGSNVRLLSLGLLLAVILVGAIWILIPYDKQVSDEKLAETKAADERSFTADIPVGASTLNLGKVAEKNTVAAASRLTKESLESSSDIATESVAAEVANNQEKAVQTDTRSVQIESEITVLGEKQPEVSALEPESVNVVTETETAPVATNDDTLLINYSKDSWTDIRDATGKKLLYRTVKKGEKIALAGKLPLTLFFGFAQGVNVTFNGVEIDVSAHTRGVFARFTVGEAASQ
jgi:cytoskeleton protein RodZ